MKQNGTRFACLSENFVFIFSLLFASHIFIFASFRFRIFPFRFGTFLSLLYFSFCFVFRFRIFLFILFRFCIYLLVSFQFILFSLPYFSLRFVSLQYFSFRFRNKGCFPSFCLKIYCFLLIFSLCFFCFTSFVSFRFFCFASLYFLFVHIWNPLSRFKVKQPPLFCFEAKRISLPFCIAALRTENEGRTVPRSQEKILKSSFFI